MHLNETARSLLRRWYLLLFGLLLTAGMSWYTFNYIQPTYEAHGSILLMPAEKTVGNHGNPFLYLGGMSEVVDVLVMRSSAAESVDPIVKQFAGTEIATTADRMTSSPVAVVDITATSEETALAALNATLSTVTRNLESMQNEIQVDSDMRISSKELVVDRKARVNSKMQVQMAIVVAGAGAVGTFLLTGFIDGFLQARKSMASRKEDENEEALKREPDFARDPQESALDSRRMAFLPGGRTAAKTSSSRSRAKL